MPLQILTKYVWHLYVRHTFKTLPDVSVPVALSAISVVCCCDKINGAQVAWVVMPVLLLVKYPTLLKGFLVQKMWLYLSKTYFPKRGSLCPFWKHALIRPHIDTSGSLIYRESQDENAIFGCSDAGILFWELWDGPTSDEERVCDKKKKYEKRRWNWSVEGKKNGWGESADKRDYRKSVISKQSESCSFQDSFIGRIEQLGHSITL